MQALKKRCTKNQPRSILLHYHKRVKPISVKRLRSMVKKGKSQEDSKIKKMKTSSTLSGKNHMIKIGNSRHKVQKNLIIWIIPQSFQNTSLKQKDIQDRSSMQNSKGAKSPRG